jgi:deoxyribose-phosphate aldolase
LFLEFRVYQDAAAPSAIPTASTIAPEELSARAQSVFPTVRELACMLDHTLLKPQATEVQVLALCAEAAEYGFACAMVNPVWVPTAVAALVGTSIRVGTVLGFPSGASLSETKQQEAKACAQAGALDLDMVLDLGAICSGDAERAGADIAAVTKVAHAHGAILKVILETCLLTEDQKRMASELCLAAGVDFLKTSTGFSTGGATVADIRLLRSIAGKRCGVKASGGIRTLADAVQMVEAGANRLGASASVAMVRELRAL